MICRIINIIAQMKGYPCVNTLIVMHGSQIKENDPEGQGKEDDE